MAQASAAEQVQALRVARIETSSRYNYQRGNVRFLQYLYKEKRELLTESFLAGVADRDVGPTDDYIMGILSPPVQLDQPPVKFADITVQEFMEFIVTLRLRNGQKPSVSTLAGYRSSFWNLFKDFEVAMPQPLGVELTNYFSGLRKVKAKEIAKGEASIKIGKDALPFSIYRWMCNKFLAYPGKTTEAIFALLALILCWNLMCRVGNGVGICLEHMEWVEDSLVIYFAHMKNDQTGDKMRFPRHVYANPLMPEICPILALGIYLLCLGPIDTAELLLFPGRNQYERYYNILKRTLTSNAEELKALGKTPENLASHSARKGAATFCSSGTTAPPSKAAIHIRGGWHQEGQDDTYLLLRKCW